MSRLQKKCLIASGGMHLLLCLILIVSAGFKSAPEKQENITLLKIIPLKAIDEPFSGGGNPAVAPLPPPPKPAEPVTAPEPIVQKPAPEPEKIAEPEPKKVEPEPEPEQVKTPDKKFVEVPKKETKKPKSLTDKVVVKKPLKKAEPKKTKIDIGRIVKRDTDEIKIAAQNAQKAEAERQANKARAAFASAANSILKNSAKSTVFDLPGQGGGEAYADYRSIVYSIYYENWNAPEEIADDQSATLARIVIARDGSVISYNIQKRSGQGALDRSVEAVLKRVQKLPAFPSSTTDSQRIFEIRFNLKAKQSLG